MILLEKIIEIGLANTELIGAGVGIGIVFGALILGVARNPSLRGQLFSYAILSFTFAEAMGLFAFMMALFVIIRCIEKTINIVNKLYFMYKKFILVFNSLPNSYSFGWLFNSPPKPYANITLSLESKITFAGFTRHLSFVNVIVSILIFIAFFLLKKFFFVELYYLINITILENTYLFKINKDLFSGVLAIISTFSLKDFIEYILEVFLPQKLLIGDEKLPLFMNQDPISNKGGLTNIAEGDVKYSGYLKSLRVEFNIFKEMMAKHTNMLNNRDIEFEKDVVTMNQPEVVEKIGTLLREQTRCYNSCLLSRMEWIKFTDRHLPQDIQDKMSICRDNIMRLQSHNVTNIEKIAKLSDEKKQVKEYFDLFNSYRTNVKKEIDNLETLSRDGFRHNHPNLYKLKEYKKLVNIDAPLVIKDFLDQDAYIKRQISEIVNAKKK